MSRPHEVVSKSSEADAFAAVASLGLGAVADVLANQVTSGRRTAEDVVPATRLRTLQGGFLTTKAAGTATLTDAVGRDAQIVAPDVALNGVVHVIDTVLLPFGL